MSRNRRSSGRGPLAAQDYSAGILAGDRTILARAITLIESRHPEDMKTARDVLAGIAAHTGKAYRVGITGVPGVGKSTFIDALGMLLTEDGHQVAVLAVDPSSAISGGSILGDKSRMPRLLASPRAFVRPSPNALTPGGVGWRTRESMLLCEAAGYDIVLVETVGVGQSEFLVADMVDFFMVLLLAGAGDELQGIKKGILELADLLAVNKADGENQPRALEAQKEYQAALRYLPSRTASWKTPVVAVSGASGEGLQDLWRLVVTHRQIMEASSELAVRRRQQNSRWMWSLIDQKLKQYFKGHAGVRLRLPELEESVLDGRISPTQAAQELLEVFSRSEFSD